MPDQNNNNIENAMIVGSEAMSVSHGADATIEHFENAEKNEVAECIWGSSHALRSMEADAKRFGHKYFAMCFIVNPKKSITVEEFMATIFPTACDVLKLPMKEATIYWHHLPLKDGKPHGHFHIAWGYANPLTGRVRDWSFDNLDNEYLGRTLDVILPGEGIVLGRFQKPVIARMRAEGHHDRADIVEAAHPPGAQPAGRTAKRAVEQPAKARGVDLREVYKTVKAAYQDSTSSADLSTALAPRGLSLVASNRDPSRPTWMIHDADGPLRSLAGCMPGVRVSTIIEKIGAPNDAARSEKPSDQPSQHRGEGPGRPNRPEGQGRSVDSLGPGENSQPGASAEAAFVSALNSIRPSVMEAIHQRALFVARGALVRALQYFANIQTKARAFLTRAPERKPPVPATLIGLRKRLTVLDEAEAAADNARGDADVAETELRHGGRPPNITIQAHATSLKAAAAQLKARRAEHDAAKKAVADFHITVQPFENAYKADIDRFQKTVVAEKVVEARRWLRASARCLALIEAAPGALTFGAPALFARAVGEDARAKPNARFRVAGQDEPKEDRPEVTPGWNR